MRPAAVFSEDAQPIRNLVRDPMPSSVTRYWYITNLGSGAPVGVVGYDAALGAYYSEVTTAASNNVYTVRIGAQGGGSIASQYGARVQEGKRYSQRIEVMSTVADGRGFSMDFYDAAGVSVGNVTLGGAGTNIALPANVWVTFELSGIAPAGAVYASTHIIYAGSSGANAAQIRPAGARLYRRNARFYEGFLRTEDWPMHGDVPGWRWMGAAANSESVGPPYALKSIVGQPIAERSSAGSTTGLLINPDAGLSLYAVYNVIDQAANFPRISALRPGVVDVYAGATGSASWTSKFTQSIDKYVTVSTGRTPGRHSLALTINPARTQMQMAVDGIAPVSTSDMIPSALILDSLILDAANASGTPLWVGLWNTQHNDETVKRVIAWLARKYGSPIPAGY